MRYMARALRSFWTGGDWDLGARGFLTWALSRVYALVGLVLLGAGLVLLLTPIPLGIVLIPTGIYVLIRSSDTAKRIFFRWVRTYPVTSEFVRKVLRRRRKSP